MTLDEAIKHAEEVAENKEKAINLAKGNPDHPMLSMSEKEITKYKKCINEHRQLAEWLRDYKRLKEQKHCEDAISREEAIKAINNDPMGGLNYEGILKRLPSVNPQPKTGRWISLDDFRGKYNENGFKCSECGEHSDYEENFCPNCGAKMQEIPAGSEGSDKG